MERLTILKQRLMRAVITVALVMACATAWAQNFTYDDNDTYTTGQYAAGMLQVFDVLGRNVFSKEDLPLNAHLSTLTYKPGVYVLRLINGDTVRTQKIVVK